jgi:hypothetical protein
MAPVAVIESWRWPLVEKGAERPFRNGNAPKLAQSCLPGGWTRRASWLLGSICALESGADS